MRKIRNLLVAAAIAFPTSVLADYTFVVPQGPGGGTSVWTGIVVEQLQPFLDEPIRIQYAPGARDVPGFNDWHNDGRDDPKTVMVSHGGNGVAFLQENVDYDYREYEAIASMNLDIIVGRRADADYRVIMAGGSGNTPEAIAIAMLVCGPTLSVAEYVDCFQNEVTWVNGMSSGERRLAYLRGELNTTRENPAAFMKHVTPSIEAGESAVWFTHGVLDAETGEHVDDVNYPGLQFEILFEERWGVLPSGDLYDAYKLVKSFRDGLQKALWMSADSPYVEVMRDAVTEMLADPDAVAAIQLAVGNYEWVVGEDGNQLRDTLMGFISVDALQTLVTFNHDALGLASVYKPELVNE